MHETHTHTHTLFLLNTHTCSYSITKYVSCTHNDGTQTKRRIHTALHLQRGAPSALVSSWNVWSSAESSCPSPAAAPWPTHSVGTSWHAHTHTNTNGHTRSLRWETLNDTFCTAPLGNRWGHRVWSQIADVVSESFFFYGQKVADLDRLSVEWE